MEERRVPRTVEPMRADGAGGNMGEKSDVQMQENPFEPYIEYLRQQLEDQDPVFVIGLVVALAVVVITCGKTCQRWC